MVTIYRFAAVHPEPEKAGSVAAVPYDVLTMEEAGETIAHNPLSFLRISRSDAELPDIPAYDDRIYERAAENLNRMRDEGVLIQDPAPSYYLYHVQDGRQSYTGLVCCVHTEDYRKGIIRRHELTRYDKEQDRTRHIDRVNAHTGMVFLVYRDDTGIDGLIEGMLPAGAELGQAVTSGGALHTKYRVTNEAVLSRLEEIFTGIPHLYIADGHHRAASAVNVAEQRKKEGRSTPESERFMAVLFSHQKVKIFGYSRLVQDLHGYTPAAFLLKVSEMADVYPYGPIDAGSHTIPPRHPDTGSHIFHMFLEGCWYEVSRKRDLREDLTGALDVSVLQKGILEGILGITDSRSDPRLSYMGGVKPLSVLEDLIRSGAYAVGFVMQPLPVGTVLAVSDQGKVMPPKSTWFEPKLLSGMLIHLLD